MKERYYNGNPLSSIDIATEARQQIPKLKDYYLSPREVIEAYLQVDFLDDFKASTVLHLLKEEFKL